MTLRKAILAAAVLVLSAPVIPALAHDDDDNGGYSSHDRYHDQLSDQHDRAHDEGFQSRAEHRAYHRDLRDQHDDAHGYQTPRYNDNYRSYNDYPRRRYRFYREY